MSINTDNIKKSNNLETSDINVNNTNDSNDSNNQNNRNAIISVSNKTNLRELGTYLLNNNYTIYSTGGTYRKLIEFFPIQKKKIISISDLTGFPEILGGRVKTLHPRVYGGILSCRNNLDHIKEVGKLNIPLFDLIVVNLYPFQETVAKQNVTEQDVIENIDIGGVSLIRAAAKNYHDVTILVNPEQYSTFIQQSEREQGVDLNDRRQYALSGYQHVAEYDNAIRDYFQDTNSKITGFREYRFQHLLKYGCNPHQKSAAIYTVGQNNMPFSILQGKMGYINTIDAVNSWLLVNELSQSLDNSPAAASFKHTSPAGAAVYAPLSSLMCQVYQLGQDNADNLSKVAVAYLRARNGDPMSSFGDFIAISHTVDECTARLIKREVSDGIIAPGYQPKALEILKKKKGGNYIILQGSREYFQQFMDKAYSGEIVEMREMFGIVISQQPNYIQTDSSFFQTDNIVTQNKKLTPESVRDMMVANISLKYAQSNNVAYAYQGQIIGLGAGQQNRVDCVRLAGRKAEKWILRQHPKVLALDSLFRERVKRQEKVNVRIRYIENDFTPQEYQHWLSYLADPNNPPEPLSDTEKRDFIRENMTEISLASDAFFPFRDNIDVASRWGVKYVLQPGGSIADPSVTKACDDYGMTMVCSGVRMFHH